MRVAGRYAIESELARGGMGTVYRALDEIEGRRVALKHLHPGLGDHVATLFQREYYTLVQLAHPRIIEVYGYGVEDGRPFYTMELLEGADLRDVAPLPVPEACRHLRDVASSLALLHARRLLHRDISPRNVRIGADGRVKLIDFGALATFGTSSHVVGTPPALPPEAVNRLELDQRSDLYGLGALAYWLLTGRHAWPASDLEGLRALWRAGAPRPPSSHAAGVPRDLDELVQSLLSLDMLGRPRTAGEVIDRLNQVAGLPSEGAPEIGSSYLVNPPMVGRDDEVAHVRDAVAGLVQGRSGGVVVTGDAGVGKRRLVLEACLQAQLAGAHVARVDAELHPGPYGVLRGLARILQLAAPEAVLAASRPHVAWIAHVVPELAAAGDALVELPRDLGEQRVRVHEEMLGFLRALCEAHPVCLAVDRADAADEGSLAVLAALVESAPRAGVLVCASIGGERAPVAEVPFARLISRCRTIELSALDRDGTHALVAAVFGEVDRRERLGVWLYERTAGNPTHALTLATQLVDLGFVRYRDGRWRLVGDLPEARSVLADVYEQRLGRLSASARALAETLSVERTASALPRCIALARGSDAEAFAALAELVEHGLLVVSDDRYQFGTTVLRDHVLARVDEGRRRELHVRSAELTLGSGAPDEFARIDAGWHLIHGGQELRGADLLEEATRGLLTSMEGLQFAAPALEAALEVYERAGVSPWVILPVLNSLTAAGWYVDHAYARKYGERTLDLALDLSGLSHAQRLAPLVGDRAAVKVGVALAVARHALQKRRIRNERLKEFKGVFAPLVGGVGILVGAAATLFDGRETQRILDKAAILRGFPDDHVLFVMYEYARYFATTASGVFGEAEPIALRVLAWFQSEQGIAGVGPEGAQALSGGIMTGLAEYSAFSDDADVERWATRLEGLGLSFYRAMGTQARFTLHTLRGETERARVHRDELERHAMRSGTLWQASVLIPLLEAATHARAGDVDRLDRAIDAIARNAEAMPVLGAYATFYRGCALRLRGRADEARQVVSSVLADVGRGRWPDWPFAAATWARILVAGGEFARAREVLAEAQSALAAGDERFVFAVLDLGLALGELELAEGRVDEAARRYRDLVARYADAGPLSRYRVHEGLARVALAGADEAAFDAAFAGADEAAREARNPALVAGVKRLERDAARAFGREAPVSEAAGAEDTWRTTGQPASVTTIVPDGAAASSARTTPVNAEEGGRLTRRD